MTGQAQVSRPDEARATAATGGGPPFGPDFFATVLHERVRAVCAAAPAAVPGVLLHLADGNTLDLCHVIALEPAWLAALIFRNREVCADMDTVFIPYGLIGRVTVTLEHSRAREMGFRVAVPAPVARGARTSPDAAAARALVGPTASPARPAS